MDLNIRKMTNDPPSPEFIIYKYKFKCRNLYSK